MNQGQFEAITSRLDRLIELLEEQAGSGMDRMNGINSSGESTATAEPEPKPAPAKAPAKRSKAA